MLLFSTSFLINTSIFFLSLFIVLLFFTSLKGTRRFQQPKNHTNLLKCIPPWPNLPFHRQASERYNQKFLNFHRNLKLFCFLGFNTYLFSRKMDGRFLMYWKNLGMETMWKIYAIPRATKSTKDYTWQIQKINNLTLTQKKFFKEKDKSKRWT